MSTGSTVLCLPSTVWARLPAYGESVITDGRGLVLFVHGLWVHPDSWRPWIDEFDRSGYDSLSVRWPGQGAAAGQGRHVPAPCSVHRLAADLAELIEGLDRRPIVIGHGIGGLLAQMLLCGGSAAAAIALAPVPSGQTVMTSVVRLTRRNRGLLRLAVRPGPVMLLPAQFQRTFANTASAAEAEELFGRVATFGRPRPLLRSLLTAGRPAPRGRDCPRGPLLLVSGGRDQAVDEVSVGALHRRYRRSFPASVTDYQVFPDRGHSLAMDGRWRSVAFYCLDWLTSQDL